MRILVLFVLLALAGCSSEDEQIHKLTFNIDMDEVPAFLAAVDKVTDNKLEIEALVDLGNGLSLDQEDQINMPVTLNGKQTELYYHVWREQEGWVHLYLSTPSEELSAALKRTMGPFVRPDDGN